MKFMHAIIALSIATLFTATFSFAHGEGEGTEERSIKLFVMDGSEPIEIDGSDLEVGESKQFFSDGDKEVIVSRDEDGYTVTIDGQEIQIGEGHAMMGMPHGAHGAHGTHSKIMVKHFGGGDGDGDGDEGEMDVHFDQDFDWHGADGNHKVMVLGMGDFKSPAQSLLDSGVLDRVDEETREEILKVLRDSKAPHHGRAHRIFIEKDEDGDEEDSD
jgi:hypothetical protein